MKRFVFVLIAVLMAGSAYAQSHEIGTLWSSGRLIWPGGLETGDTDPDIGYRIGNPGFAVVGLYSTFNVPSYYEGGQHLVNTTQSPWCNDLLDDLADFSSSKLGGTQTRLNRPNPKFFRINPPTLVQDGKEILRTNWRLFPEDDDAVRSDLGADLMISSTIVNSEGLRIVRETYSWANQDADDMIFEVTTITYPENPYVVDLRAGERGIAASPETAQRNSSYDNFHVGLNYYLQRGGSGPAGGAHITINPEDGGRAYDAGLLAGGIWDEVNYWDDDEKLLYIHDGDDSDKLGYRPDGDDRGEPAPATGDLLDSVRNANISSGEFMESHYKGRVFLHVDKTPTNDPNVLSENWLDDNSNPENAQPRHVRWVAGEVWTSTRTADRKTVYDFYVQPNTIRRDDRIAISDPDRPGYVTTEQIYQWVTTFGPWDLNPGQSIHIVSAVIVAGPSEAENKRVGRAWADGTMGFVEKEAFLDSGLDSLKATVAVARQAWANRTSTMPRLPATPNWPASVTVTSGPDQNELSWDAVSGAAKYHVYRYAGRHTEVSELIGTPTGTTFNDETALRGTRYYYSVTAVDANGLESSRFATRTEADGVSPFRGPTNDVTQVRIVPNPYQVQGGQLNDGGFNYQGQPNKLQFVNLPGQAVIHIFTITGDLVTRLDHTSGSGDESWDLMISDNNQFLVSGIYFAHIEDTATGDKHVERFVVVR